MSNVIEPSIIDFKPDLAEVVVAPKENIHLVQPACRFLALPDEAGRQRVQTKAGCSCAETPSCLVQEWYRKLHLVLEAEGGRAIAAAHQSIRSAMKQRNNRDMAVRGPRQVGGLLRFLDCEVKVSVERIGAEARRTLQ